MNCSEDMIEAANEHIETIFAETAILLTHPDEGRRALARDRIYAILFASGMEARQGGNEVPSSDDSPTAEGGDAQGDKS